MSDREESPDWLREFKAPASNIVTLSSESSPENSPRKSYSDHALQEENEPPQEKKGAILFDIEDYSPVKKTRKTKLPKTRKDHDLGEDSLDKYEEEPEAANTTGKQAGRSVSTRLPLVFPDKVNRSKALVECDGDSIDLSGDVGAVGRIVFSNSSSGNPEMLLDLKGTIYKTTIVPSRTFCVVSVGQSEAKIEAIMNDFIQLEPQSNVFESETMVEGTLEGFSFGSDEEGDKAPKTSAHQSDQNKENGDQANPKTKRKRKADKPLGKTNKKAKAAVRQPKTVKRTKKSKK